MEETIVGYAFISYSTKNQASADAMRELFKKHNIDTWMAPYDIPAGSSYMGEINRALVGCDCLVLMLSEAAQNSQWVLKELERAVSYKKTIVPIKIEDIVLNDDFDFVLGSCHVVAIQKIDENANEIKKVIKAVKVYTDVTRESTIDVEIENLRVKYPEDSELLNKFSGICSEQSESIFINNFDFDKTREYIAFLKKHFENSIHVDMQQFLDEIVLLLTENKNLKEFYEKYKECDVLVIDDFQFCFGKQSTQESIYRILKHRMDNRLATIVFCYSEVLDYSTVVGKFLLNLIYSYDNFGTNLLIHSNENHIAEDAVTSNAEEIKNDKSNDAIVSDPNPDTVNDVVLTAEQQTKLNDCHCGYCGMSALVKKEANGFVVKCSYCGANGTIAETIDAALNNWVSCSANEEVVRNIVEVESTFEESDDSLALANSTEKLKGHLVSSYRRVLNISSDDCINPIEISMPDETVKTFDLCDEFAVSNQKKYIVVRQKTEKNEYLLFVFRSRNGSHTLITEGQDQKKVYRWFREKHASEYDFTDEKAAVVREKKKKHFAQDTVPRLYPTVDHIPQMLSIPNKYAYISSNAFAKLTPNGKEIRQIIIPDSVEVIEDNAFSGLTVTEAVYIPKSVKRIGKDAFDLVGEAYIYCEKPAHSYHNLPEEKVVEDTPYNKGSSANRISAVIDAISHSNSFTRIKSDTLLTYSHTNSEIDEIVLSDTVCVLDSYALCYVKIKNRIVIPNKVTKIGSRAFELMPEAYVECNENSYAYYYCKENGIRNSVDISNFYRSKGVCAYCGGTFSGLFNKKCRICGKEKNY